MRRVLVLVGVLALVAAACGGGDEGDNGGDGGDAGSAELTFGMVEFEFDPTEASAPSGAEVSVTVENTGSIEHNWILVRAGEEIASEDEIPDDLSSIAIINLLANPGESESGTFTAPEPGSYQIICDIAGHFTAGMEGTLTVTG